MIDVAANWRRVRAAADAAALRVGRPPAEVRIVVASKRKSAELIERAIAAGARDFGENYVQEAAAKIPRLRSAARWHLIGHLQRNKAARAAELFDVVQTVDSEAAATTLARHSERYGRPLAVLIEVNLASEANKNGAPQDAVAPLAAAINRERWLRLEGLMAIPPVTPEAEASRPYFRRLRQLRDDLASVLAPGTMRELSMGMSEDFEVAIEEGATMVRIGRAILGERSD